MKKLKFGELLHSRTNNTKPHANPDTKPEVNLNSGEKFRAKSDAQTAQNSGTNPAPANFQNFFTAKKALPLRVLLLLFWLGALTFGGIAQGKISTVAENDAAVFLPESAESTLADRAAQKFTKQQTIPVLIVASTENDAKLSPAQLKALAEFAQNFPAQEIAPGEPIADFIANPIPVIPNPQGTAALLPAALDAEKTAALTDAGEKKLNAIITKIRATVAETDFPTQNQEKLQVNVSGPAGLVADLSSAFAGIDLTLLLVTLFVVFLILVVVYRSILLPIIVLFTAMAALCAAVFVVFESAKAEIFTLNSQTQGILAILVIGATTDYCLLLIARYREEIAVQAHALQAMAVALKGSWEPILASGGTVIAGLLTLMISDLSSTASLGPIAAIGIIFAMLAALTLLPGLLLLPRKHPQIVFWPAKIVPRKTARQDLQEVFAQHGIWGKVAKFVGRKARPVWLTVFVVLAAFAAIAPMFQATGTSAIDAFLKRTDAVVGFTLLQEKFTAGSAQPTTVIVAAEKIEEAREKISQISGVEAVSAQGESNLPAGAPMPDSALGAAGRQPKTSAASNGTPTVVAQKVLLNVTTKMPAEELAAREVVAEIRAAVKEIDPAALVGGPAAQSLDTQNTANADFQKIVPVVLGVIFVMLVLLLRSLLAPTLLLIANLLSFGTALGAVKLLFDYLLQYPGADATVPIYAFVFLVALGIDYTIFLMSRAREESLKHGARAGILRAVAVTGGVITSAGVVLAATFAALAVVPLLFMVQLAIIVALGILIDTFIVRSLLIPGLVYDIGRRTWWPWTWRKIAAD